MADALLTFAAVASAVLFLGRRPPPPAAASAAPAAAPPPPTSSRGAPLLPGGRPLHVFTLSRLPPAAGGPFPSPLRSRLSWTVAGDMVLSSQFVGRDALLEAATGAPPPPAEGALGGGGAPAQESAVGWDAVQWAASKTPLALADNALRAFQKGGPHGSLAFDPAGVRAAIVTCGGLCPGLNTVVRELVMCLHYTYNVRAIWGVRSGYRGFYDAAAPWLRLTPDVVTDIHNDGGTMLGSSRGGFESGSDVDRDKILDMLSGGRAETAGAPVNMLFVIGGDGTQRGASRLAQGALARGIRLAVAGVPKTIDNDIPLVDKTFGFETAVEEAVRPIHCANVEAKAAPGGVGIVKLMGRDAGFIALHAAMASRVANLVILPEKRWSVAKLLQWLQARLKAKGHAVIVVAEGADTSCAELEAELLALKAAKATGAAPRDASGNVLHAKDVGVFLKEEVSKFFGSPEKPANGTAGASVKYIDPSYIIRSAPPCASDSNLCTTLAYDAVHGAFAGFTDLCGSPPPLHPPHLPPPLSRAC
jgi:6-phosphofructokinase 1